MSATEAKLNVYLSERCERKKVIQELAQLRGVLSVVRLFPKASYNDELSWIYIATVKLDALNRGIATMIERHLGVVGVAYVEDAPKRRLIKPSKRKQPPK